MGVKTTMRFHLTTVRMAIINKTGDTHFASLNNQKKDNNKFKNKNLPELPESQTAWKSNNQGVKEETLIQTGRKDGDA